MITFSVASQTPSDTSAYVTSNLLRVRRYCAFVINITTDASGVNSATLDAPIALPAGVVFAYSAGMATLTATNVTSFAQNTNYTVNFLDVSSNIIDTQEFNIQVVHNFEMTLTGSAFTLTNYATADLDYSLALMLPDYTFDTAITGTAVYGTPASLTLEDGYYEITLDDTVIPFFAIGGIYNCEQRLLNPCNCNCAKNFCDLTKEILVGENIQKVRDNLRDILFQKTPEFLQLPDVTDYLADKATEIQQIVFLIEKTKDICGCYADVSTPTNATLTISTYPNTSDCGCN